MTAAEVLEWLEKYGGTQVAEKIFGFGLDGDAPGIDNILERYYPQEIIDKITAYEAAKRKPVEVEFGWHCEIFDKGRVLDEKEIWEGDEEHAKDEAAERAEQYVAENGGTVCYRVWGICRVKEDK